MSHSIDTVTSRQRAALGLTSQPTLDSWQTAPDNRWVFRHVEEHIPSAVISAIPASTDSATSESEMPEALRSVPNLLERLDASCTDALVVERGGEIIAEWAAGGFGLDRTHLLMSVSKSLCGILVGTLIDDGLIDQTATADSYVAELAGSAFGDATIQQLLDMTAAVNYSEEYTDPAAEVQAHDRAAGWRLPMPGDPANTFEFLARLTKSREHGECFQYCSAVTDTLGWIIEAATGSRYADVLSERFWSKLGASRDARVSVDRGGCAIANGGISCTARDLALVGRLMLGGGEINGVRVVSARWVGQTLAGGDPAHAAKSPTREVFPGLSYRNQWWSTGNERGNVYGVGIHGQYLWLDPITDTVIVKFSTLPAPVSLADTRAAAELFADIVTALE
ncbi:MAG: serine hydrolase domain-containing protein [Leucobacter sp.]